jgi:hypothetical protein
VTVNTPQDPYASSMPVASPRNPLGRASLIVASIGVLLGVIVQVMATGMPFIMQSADLEPMQVGLLLGAFGVVRGVIALVALILGLMALGKYGAPKGAAGAGTALGATGVLGAIVSVLLPAVFSALH